MNVELSQRERAIAIAIGATLVILALVACVGIFRARRALLTQIDTLQTHLSAVTIERDAVTHDRDARTEQMKPFESLAEQQFASAPPDERLSLLLRRIETITTAMSRIRGRRHLDAAAIARIRAKLDLAPGLDIEVGGIWPDPEALALAEQLKAVFEGAGLKTRKLAQYTPPTNIPAGVSVYSKHELDHVLSDAIAQIFAELDQPRLQWLDDDVVPSDRPTDGQPELKIIVGRR